MWRETLVRLFPALRSFGPSFYVVGGAVRDLHLHREPADVDVACRDPLAVARSLGRQVIVLGPPGRPVAYRVDLGMHVYDFAEIAGGEIDRDLERRDFTMNAMAVDLGRDTLLDPHGGRRDLEAGLVRMTSASVFDGWPVQLLRAVRMAVKYDFAIEPSTIDAIRRNAFRIHEVRDVVPHFVTKELGLIFSCGRLRKTIALLRATGLDRPLGLELRDVRTDDVSPAGAYALLVADPAAYAATWRWSEELLHEVLRSCGVTR